MTPQEKCDELIKLFISVINYKNDDDELIIHKEPFTVAKKCAFKLANETWKVLWNLYDNPNTSDSSEIIIKEQIDFWDEVKTEIENL